MLNNVDSLDTLMNGDVNEQKDTTTINDDDYISLEDEFAALLNDFIQQDNKKPALTSAERSIFATTPTDGGLDSFASSNSGGGLDSLATSNNGGLDSFTSSNGGGLDSFVSSGGEGGLDSLLSPSSSSGFDAGGLDSLVSGGNNDSGSGLDGFVTGGSGLSGGGLDSLISPVEAGTSKNNASTNDDDEEKDGSLKTEEQELARAMSNFQDAIFAMTDKKNLSAPTTDYEESMLTPNYKPSVGRKIAQYLLDCWDVINKYDPENMKRLSKDANDEEYLSFAESLSDTDMQLAIISYVEILINIEICEVGYEQRKENAQKNRIKKELYEEYMELQERKATFIKKLKEKNFPIDAEKLINNYFRAAQKDASGAFDALIKNPAMFAPIDFSKIKARFFGLIKVTPEDGIKANQKIGEFIKKLKV